MIGPSVGGAVVGAVDVVVGPAGEVAGVASAVAFQRLLELVLQVVLGPGLVDPGAPELVGDEQEEQEPDRDQHAARRPRAPGAWAPRLTATSRGPRPPVRPLRASSS